MNSIAHDFVVRLGQLGVVPVVTLHDADLARPLAAALVDGGLPIAEITFRTSVAADAIRTMGESNELLVGAGTVLTVAHVDEAADAGARFVVSPGLSAPVVGRCQELGIPALPGVATATEIQTALSLGISTLKLFPAEAMGGLAAVDALAAAFPTVRFVPTGGVTASSAPSYLAHRSVLAVGGSWITSGDLLATQDWATVTRLAAEAVSMAQPASDDL